MNYRKSIVTFLDVLGFRNIVESKSADEIHELLQDSQNTHNLIISRLHSSK